MIHYNSFLRFPEVFAFTTTKEDFEDDAPRFSEKHLQKALNFREALAMRTGLKPHQLIFPNQCHTANVRVIETIPQTELNETDALITAMPGVCICVQTADCVPVLLYDHKNRIAAAVHAGWRGTLAGIVGETIKTMTENFYSKAGNIYAVIGPSISGEVYETGSEVVQLFETNTDYADQILVRQDNGRYHIDLWKANQIQMVRMGIPENQIEIAGQCTYQNPDKYFSARRDGIATGRMVSGILIRH